jgi:prevent-host-death family protein
MPEIISSREAQNHFGMLLDTAQRVPVVVKRHNRECVAVISMQEYEAWQAFKNARLQNAADMLAASAVERGLTPALLDTLLSNDA